MAGVDSLLRMAVQNTADELHLATDQAPRMLRKGAPVRLSIPPTPDDMLRLLLDPLITPEREASLRSGGKVELSYTPDGGGEAYAVTLQRRGPPVAAGASFGFEAIFRRGAARAIGATPSQVATPAPPPLRASPTVTPQSVRPEATRAPYVSPPRPVESALPPPASVLPPIATSSPGLTAELVALVHRAVSLQASDVHLFSGEQPALRIDGSLRPLADLPPADVESLFAGFLDGDARASIAAGKSVDLAFEVPEVGRFRLNLYRASNRLAAALRVLRRGAPELRELNLPVPLDELVELPHGLVIVCGPTGSGKSATLAAIAQETMRRRAGLLISLEDPIEYVIQPERGMVRQRQIGPDVRNFPTGLRDALREDPDILLIGEMRDPETISLALTAAETGHLVLTSLHSRSAASSVERIVDSYPPERQQQIRVQLADALRAVVSQRLVPRARGAGRLPALELMRGNHTVAALIREGKTEQLATVIQSSRKEGMLPLERCLADLVRSGQITRPQANAVANDAGSLGLYLQN